MANQLPVIGITTGDPAGIGPEISLKAVADPVLRTLCRPVLIGDLEYLERQTASVGIDLRLTEFDKGSVGIEVFDLANVPPSVKTGEESEASGRASAQYIEAAVELWSEKRIDAIATAPISKHAIALAGYDFPGHTEFLARMTKTEKFAMSFFADNLRVVLLSTHVPLRRALDLVTSPALVDLIKFTDLTMSSLLKREVKIAVAGINPHASEGGMFGSEEADVILPAVAESRAAGIDVHGPYSPDTIFLRGFRGEFDAVIACYHDQATIAVKSLAFGSSVNVTLGLPLIRTSVDHGTAFDIAGRGIADASSMSAAVKLAARLAINAHESGSAAQ